MTTVQFNIFSDFRNDFRTYCKKLSEEFSSILIPLQKNAAQKDTPDYPLENPVIYNTALDEIKEQSQIQLIVIDDKPEKDERIIEVKKIPDKNDVNLVPAIFPSNICK